MTSSGPSEDRRVLLLFIPGFGPPHLAHKMAILESNLKTVGLLKDTGLFASVSVSIGVYDTTPETATMLRHLLHQTELNSNRFLKGTLYIHEGIVGNFLLEHANPRDLPPTVSHLMILLDDVELAHPTHEWSAERWKHLFYDIHFHKIDVCSPLLCADSKCLFPYMRQRTHFATDTLSLASACELFCYILPRTAYERYYRELSPSHPWLWGIDLVLHKHLGFRVGLVHYVSIRHHYQSTPDTSEVCVSAFKAMEDYLKRYGETQASLATQPAILQDIYVYHRI